ncbi:uncharacterized protein LOC134290623 [Aedes albopictus]|uniref:Integrase catalytic domain-containing protein n=1 Tax=Aedes albopictus TaxID=7160 RepID=A0ABM1ZBU7_AEDAL
MSSQGSRRGTPTVQTNVAGAISVTEWNTDRNQSSVEQSVVNPKVPPPEQQVIDNKTDKANPAYSGAVKKTITIPAASREAPVVNVPLATASNVNNDFVRRNPFRRARENRYDRCQVCGNQISDNLLQCNGCNANYHLVCVKMSSGPEGLTWWCRNCQTAVSAGFKPRQLQRVPTKASSDPTANTQGEISHYNPPPAAPPKSQVQIQEPILRGTRSKGSISSRGASRRIELQLQKLEEEKKFHQQYLDQKYSLMLELDSECSSEVLDENELEKIEDWIAATEGCADELDSGVDAELTMEGHRHGNANLLTEHIARRADQLDTQAFNVNELHRVPVGNIGNRQARPAAPVTCNPNDIRAAPVGIHGQGRAAYVPPDQNMRRACTTNNFLPQQGSTPMRQTAREHDPTIFPQHFDPVGNETVCILNRSQLAARQAVSRDLPEFSGNSEDWPLFLSVFNTSTQMCGFSPEENMLRLRKCLKDRALEAVRCRLLHPSNVDGVIATLKMLYGRPEAIIQSIIKKVRSLPAPNMEKLETVVNFALAVENLVATMQACQIGDFVYNASLRLELVDRLPPTLKLDWAKCVRNNPAPNLIDFSSWLYNTAEDASAVMVSPSTGLRPRSTKKEGFLNHHSETSPDVSRRQCVKSATESSTKSETSRICIVCKGTCSALHNCKRFNEFSFDSKWATIKEHKLCRKCLRKHNGNCRLKQQCGVNGCTYLHHPLLHGTRHASGESNGPQQDPPRVETTSVNVHQGQSDFLFRIFPVTLHGPHKTIRTYAFVDDGSELTLIEQSLADELGVKGTNIPLCLKWTGDTCRVEKSSQQIGLQISAVQNPEKRFSLSDVRTVGNLKIRPQTLRASELQERYPHLAGIPLESYRNISPGLLIGLDNAALGHVTKSREGNLNEPIAVKTRLGWTVYGCCSTDTKRIHHVNHHSVEACHCNASDEDLHLAMKQYFALDSLGVTIPSKQLMSSEDQRARTLLQTLTIPKEGRYECGLLWKYDNVRLPDSKQMALNRWKCLDRRLMKDSSLAEVLRLKIGEYIAKGYISKLSTEELMIPRPRVWYLPMFPVWNPNKPGKTRLVWDAAATAHGVSLNSVLLKGPDQLASLLTILIKFREFKIAVCADLREMYHQVLMREDDQHCQRFFWKHNDTDPEPSVYVMKVQSFGACCSPSIAQHVKNHNAEKFKQECPAAVEAITKCHYVDDMLMSVETEEEAVQVSTDVRKIHKQGGFEMHNWLSNSPRVLQILKEPTTKEKDFSIGQDTMAEKVLGMWWETNSDCFTYKLSSRLDSGLLSGDRRPTKREVLRTLMMLYDPLGLIAHFTMLLKVLLQEIWRTSVDWDDEIEDAQFAKWLTWLKALPSIADIKIPRCYRVETSLADGIEIQLHTFMDASESGFAAIVYLRFQDTKSIECSLVGAKTRVAPLKFLSIPRSELQSCILGVRLSETILQSLSVKVSRRFFWTDSRDVLCWLNSDHRRYSQFVAHRVSEILEVSNADEWYWIPTKHNVADDGTKWKQTINLSSSCRWFTGPDFLRKPPDTWPGTTRSIGTTEEELRPHLLTHVQTEDPIIAPQNFSQWSRLLRRIAYLYRFVDCWKARLHKVPIAQGTLTQAELAKAERYLYRLAQANAYSAEVTALSTNAATKSPRQVANHSSIRRLSPFLDEHGILRVRGRTSACKFIDYNAVNPIILPHQEHITRLIVEDFHRRFLHQNHATTMNEIRQQFHVTRLKSVYRTVRRKCQQCRNDHAAPQPPAMADLPQSRLAAFSLSFVYMGVDYFGPLLVVVGRRTEKRWGVLGTCLTTRAICIEIAHTLTTDSCVMALRNIMVRRGVPAVIYSDRGTNFQGASKDVQQEMHNLQERLVTAFTTSKTEWVFIPPASPHMGGAWERMIRTVKQNLNKLLPNRFPSDEVLRNTMMEVENIVNSRPLTEIPLDNDQSPVLTPNHFLVGSQNGLKPRIPFDDSPVALKYGWQHSQVMANRYWKQWLRDYLPTITRRNKWFNNVKPIEVNDIVVIVDPQLPRNQWPRGRVIGVTTSADGQVRSATVQTSNGGIYERPAVKLAVLDVGVSKNTATEDPTCISGGEC